MRTAILLRTVSSSSIRNRCVCFVRRKNSYISRKSGLEKLTEKLQIFENLTLRLGVLNKIHILYIFFWILRKNCSMGIQAF